MPSLGAFRGEGSVLMNKTVNHDLLIINGNVNEY